MTQPANTNLPPQLGQSFDLYFTGLGFGPGRPHLHGPRLTEALRLHGLSDAALRQMRITRGDIPRIVFRDLFTI